MAVEGFCEKHGPYKTDDGNCPYCQREQQQRGRIPDAPRPLGDETETGWLPRQTRGTAATAVYDEDDDTRWPTGVSGAGGRTPEEDDTVVVRAKKGLLGWLVIKEGNRRGQVAPIANGTTVGRSGTNILLLDKKVSRSHARFRIEEDQFVLWDLGSENGTFVNGNLIREATPLNENDEIEIGDTKMVLKVLP